MRIATANAFDTGIDTLTSRQADLSEAQVQLASGKRVAKASDDPAAAARAEHALAGILRSDTSQRAVDAARTAMSQTETALSDAGDLLQQAREAIVAAGNASYGDPERASACRAAEGDPQPASRRGESQRRCRHLPVRRPGCDAEAVRRRTGRRAVRRHDRPARNREDRPRCRCRATARPPGCRRRPATACSRRAPRPASRTRPSTTARSESGAADRVGLHAAVRLERRHDDLRRAEGRSADGRDRSAVRVRAIDRHRRHAGQRQGCAGQRRSIPDRAVDADA